jgi:dihydroceramidase
LALYGFIGLIWGNPVHEKNVAVMFLILTVVGLGSVGLHSTLHWFPQSSDEVPMLWQTLSFLYVLILTEFKVKNSFGLGFLFFCLAAVQTYLYYAYQEVYMVFITTMVLYATTCIVWSGIIMTKNWNKKYYFEFWSSSFICFVLIGFVLWIIDMNYCKKLLPIYRMFGGATLHVFWHVFAGLGTYLLINFFVLIRIYDRNLEPKCEWVMGILPVLTVRKPSSK